MTLEPLIHAPLVVQLHVATVVPAFVLGVWLLAFSRKGLRWHRAVGLLFLALMVTTAIVTAFHPSPNAGKPGVRHEPDHLFVPFVLFATWRALDGAVKGDIKQHKRWVMGLFFGALVINGVNNIFFLPGITRDIFFTR